MDTPRKDEGDRDRTGEEQEHRDLSDTPDVGLIADEDLPQDLQPDEREREQSDEGDVEDAPKEPGAPPG